MLLTNTEITVFETIMLILKKLNHLSFIIHLKRLPTEQTNWIHKNYPCPCYQIIQNLHVIQNKQYSHKYENILIQNHFKNT